MQNTRSLTLRMISDFCRLRLKAALDDTEIELMTSYLNELIELMSYPPYRGSKADWVMLADATGIEASRLRAVGSKLQPVLDAVARSVAMSGHTVPIPPSSNKTRSKPSVKACNNGIRSRRGPAPKSIVEFPEPLFTEWEDPTGFGDALNLHMRRHGDSVRHLYLSLASRGERNRTAPRRSVDLTAYLHCREPAQRHRVIADSVAAVGRRPVGCGTRHEIDATIAVLIFCNDARDGWFRQQHA